jgi:hypothetical protein
MTHKAAFSDSQAKPSQALSVRLLIPQLLLLQVLLVRYCACLKHLALTVRVSRIAVGNKGGIRHLTPLHTALAAITSALQFESWVRNSSQTLTAGGYISAHFIVATFVLSKYSKLLRTGVLTNPDATCALA